MSSPNSRVPRLVVVVPARNEQERVPACLTSLAPQGHEVTVYFSDNDSHDATSARAEAMRSQLDLVTRRTTLLPAVEHFVSTARWAMAEIPDAAYFAFLAGDDTWTDGFAEAAICALESDRRLGAVFPTFVWEGDGPDRVLEPMDFRQERGRARQRAALLAADRRELANLLYGVFRRDAFELLLEAWERGGDQFASDYAAAWALLGRHRVASCPAAVGRRHVRPETDLLGRVGLRRADARGLVGVARMYVVLNVRVNGLIADALRRTSASRPIPNAQLQVLRAPQWLVGAVRQLRAGGLSGGSGA